MQELPLQLAFKRKYTKFFHSAPSKEMNLVRKECCKDCLLGVRGWKSSLVNHIGLEDCRDKTESGKAGWGRISDLSDEGMEEAGSHCWLFYYFSDSSGFTQYLTPDLYWLRLINLCFIWHLIWCRKTWDNHLPWFAVITAATSDHSGSHSCQSLLFFSPLLKSSEQAWDFSVTASLEESPQALGL